MDVIINNLIDEITKRQIIRGFEEKPIVCWGMEIAENLGNMYKSINDYYNNQNDKTKQDIYDNTIHIMMLCSLMLENIERLNRSCSGDLNNENMISPMEKILNDLSNKVTEHHYIYGFEEKAGAFWGMDIAENFGNICKSISAFNNNPADETEKDIYDTTIQLLLSCTLMLKHVKQLYRIWGDYVKNENVK